MQFRVDTDGMTFIVGGIRGVMDFETKTPCWTSHRAHRFSTWT